MLHETDSTPVFLLDKSGVIIECNWKACEFTGLKAEEIEGRHFGEFILADSKSTGVLVGENTLSVTSFTHKDGTTSSVLGIVSSFVKKGKQFHNLTIFDISPGSPISNNDRIANIKLLAGYIAHDFNNILTGILGSLSTLRGGVENAIQYDELLRNAEAGALRARMLSNQILAFSRGEITSIFDKTAKPEDSSKSTILDPDLDSGRLLLLEADKLVSDTATGMLNTLGYTVDVVVESGAALERFRGALKSKYAYRAVVIDLSIKGGMDSLLILKFILEMQSDAAVIISSGNVRDEVMINYKKYGFKGALLKPYTVRELFEALQKAL